MNAASIREVLSAWEAAARSVGRNLPVGIVERGLALLPDSPQWAISEDAGALFALTKDDFLFSLGLSSDSESHYAVGRCTPIAFSCVCPGANPSRPRQTA